MRKGIFIFLVIGSIFWSSAAALAEENTTSTKVACVGDSITFGFGIEDRRNKSYPAQLAVILGEGWSVGNFGRNGRTALRQGHAPYWETQEYEAALKSKPDVVVIKLGTNDLRAMNWEKHRADYIPDYVELIRSFQALESKPTVWICYPTSIYPGHKKFKFGNEMIENELIPKIDEISRQTGVKIIDLNTALRDKNDMFPDNIHPNADGAKRIAIAVSKAIAK